MHSWNLGKTSDRLCMHPVITRPIVLNICQKRWSEGCVILYCNLQCGITQPILRLFWHICSLLSRMPPLTLVSYWGQRHVSGGSYKRAALYISWGNEAISCPHYLSPVSQLDASRRQARLQKCQGHGTPDGVVWPKTRMWESFCGLTKIFYYPSDPMAASLFNVKCLSFPCPCIDYAACHFVSLAFLQSGLTTSVLILMSE